MTTYAKKITLQKRMEIFNKILQIYSYHNVGVSIENAIEFGIDKKFNIEPICIQFTYDFVEYKYEGYLSKELVFVEIIHKGKHFCDETALQQVLDELDEAISTYGKRSL